MKSLHKTAVSKVFKFHDFTEDDVTAGVEQLVSEEAFLTFSDEDFFFKREEPIEEEEEPAPEDVDFAAEEEEEEEPEEAEIVEDPAIAIAAGIVEEAEERAKKIIEDANEEAEKALKEAKQKANELFTEAEEDGRKNGFEQGFSAGSEEGKKEYLAKSGERIRSFFTAADAACENIDAQKKEILEHNLMDLGDLALAVAEKIVCIALDSSGEVVKRMIMSAAAPAGETQWAKVTISGKDVEMMREDGIDIFEELYSVTDKIDIIVLDDADNGTCFIEFPNYVIDAGTGTQLQNIKDMIHTADRD